MQRTRDSLQRVTVRARQALLLAALSALGGTTARGDLYWDPAGATPPNGGTGTWSTAGAWSSDPNTYIAATWNNVTNSGTQAVFPTSIGTVTLTGPQTAGSLQFTANAPSYVITGSTLTLNGGIDMKTTTTSTLATVTINSNLSTTDLTILKDNANTLSARVALGGDNTIAGTITLDTPFQPNAGQGMRLDINSPNAIKNTGNATGYADILFNTPGAVVQAAAGGLGNSVTIGNVNMNGYGGSIGAFSNSATSRDTINVNGVISGLGNLTFQTNAGGGGGVVNLNTVNTYGNGGSATNGSTTAFNTGTTSSGWGYVVWNQDNALPTNTRMQVGADNSTFGTGAIDLHGKSQIVAALGSGTTTGASQGITNSGTTLSTLTITGNSNTTFKSVIGTPTVAIAPIPAGANLNNIALVLGATHSGVISLTALNTYTGGTTVNAGTLLANSTNATGTGSVTVASGAALGGAGTIAGAVNNSGSLLPGESVTAGVDDFSGTLTTGKIGTLSIGGGLTLNSGASLNYDFTTITADKVAVTGAVALPASGTETVNITYSGTVANGTFHLITYSGAISGAFSTLKFGNGLQTTTISGATFTLQNNANGVDVSVTGGTDLLIWRGAGGTPNGSWDTSSSNWIVSGPNTPSVYADNTLVEFDDSANSTGAAAVTYSGAVAPLQTLFNNSSRDYLMNSTGGTGITGTTGIIKNGTAAVTFAGTNSFTGPISLNAGSLVLGSNNAISQTSGVTFSGNASLVASGTFATNRTMNFSTGGGQVNTGANAVTFTGTLTGAGTLTKTGTGTLLLGTTDAASFTGGVNANAGTVRVSSVDAGQNNLSGLGVGTTTVNSSGTLQLDNLTLNANGAGSGATILMSGGSALATAGTLAATGNVIIERSQAFQIATGVSATHVSVALKPLAATDSLTIAHTMRRSPAGSGDQFADVYVNGLGTVVLGGGAFSATSTFSGSWFVNSGTLQMGPYSNLNDGEVLNSVGFRDGDPKSANPVTVNTGGTLTGAINSTTDATTPQYYRANITLNGGSLGSTQLNANYGGNFIVNAGTSFIDVFDTAAPGTARDVNLVGGTATTLNNTAGTTWTGNLTVTPGSLTTGGAFNIARDGGTFSVTTGSTLTINAGATVNLGGTADALTDGTRFVNVVNNSVTSFHVTAGTKNVGTIDGLGNTTVDGSTTLIATHIMQNTLNANGLAKVRASGAPTGVSKLATLNIGGAGQLDLTNNKLIVTTVGAIGSWNGSNYTGVLGQVKTGRNGANWNGNGIITSLTAAGIANQLTTLAAVTASDAKGITSGTATFGGQTVNATDTLVMYTWTGDVNLDGKINADDYFQIDKNYNKSADSFKKYYNGDFNYDGKINGDDYSLIDAAFAGQTPGAISPGPGLDGVSAVPEPASLAFIVAAGSLLGLHDVEETSDGGLSLPGRCLAVVAGAAFFNSGGRGLLVAAEVDVTVCSALPLGAGT